MCVSALTMAALYCHTDTLQLLLQRRADVNICNGRGTPALLNAARAGHWAGLELLMQYGAELESCDRQQRTALMLAAAEGHPAVIDMLLAKGASLARSIVTQRACAVVLRALFILPTATRSERPRGGATVELFQSLTETLIILLCHC